MTNQRYVPVRVPQGRAYLQPHALGQEPTAPAPGPLALRDDFVEVPAFYTVSIILGGETGAQQGGSAALRPERFECRRITYAAQADAPPFISFPFGNPTGNCVEISWGDEFTQFLGNQPALLAALFGSQNGFLDLPQGILFQGRQTLNVKLRRLQWPDPATEPQDSRIDVTFHGVGLLPRGTGGYSGGL